MKVSSPVGEFPFEPRRLRVHDGHLVLDASMGAWPATVVLEPGDVVRVVRLLPWPLLVLGAAAVIGILGRRTRTSGR